MPTLPDLPLPFDVEQLYDVRRTGGFVVVHRERRRVLARRPDGVMLWAYLRHGRTVVRLEVVRGAAAQALLREIVVPKHAPRRWSRALTPGKPLERALEDAAAGAARYLGEVEARSHVFELRGRLLVVDVDGEDCVLDHRVIEEGALWLAERNMHRAVSVDDAVDGVLSGGAPFSVLLLGERGVLSPARSRLWHPEVRVLELELSRNELAADVLGPASRLSATLEQAERAGRPVSVIVTEHELGESAEDIRTLEGVAALCGRYLAVFIAVAAPSLLGRAGRGPAVRKPINASRLRGVFESRSHEAWSALRDTPESRWLCLTLEKQDAVELLWRLHDGFAFDGWCANPAPSYSAAPSYIAAPCYFAAPSCGTRAAAALQVHGIAVISDVSVARYTAFHPPRDEPHLDDFLRGTLAIARVFTALRYAAPQDARAWLGELVVAEHSPLARGRVTVEEEGGERIATMALWLRMGAELRWVTLRATLPQMGQQAPPPLRFAAPASRPKPIEARGLLRERVTIHLPGDATVHDALACPGEVWRVDAPEEATWSRAQRSVDRGASPELHVASFTAGGSTVLVSAEETSRRSTAHRPGDVVTPWELPAEHAICARLGVTVASRMLGDLRLTVSAALGTSPPWLTSFAAFLLDGATPGAREPERDRVAFPVGADRVARLSLAGRHRARVLVEGSVSSCELRGDGEAHDRLAIHALGREDLHLPYVAPGEQDVAEVMGERVSFRRDVQRGRVVRDAAVALGAGSSGQCLYIVSEIDGADDERWREHREALASLSLSPDEAVVAPAVAGDWRSLYEIEAFLGRGGAADVHRVRHKGWALDLAVKRPREDVASTEDGAEPLAQTLTAEAEAWTKLGPHPNVVSCYQARQHAGVPHIFVELVEGGTLAEWIEDGRVFGAAGDPSGFSSAETHRQASAFARILDIGIQMAHGLHHAHEHGLIHQDVKPGNVMLTEHGVAKVTDFGLVKASRTSHEVEVAHTVVATCGGLTPAYCSPEQATAVSTGAKLTRRTDIWSWAVVMLEMFNGGVSWRSGALAHVVLQELRKHGPVESAAPPLPEELGTLLSACLRVDPDQRPHDMMEIATEVARIYHQTLGNRYPRRAPRSADGRADVLTNRGASLMDLARPSDAVSAWQAALDVEPMHLEAGYDHALHRHRRGAADLGDRMGELLLAHPGRWEAWHALAWAHVERGDADAAATAIERARVLGAPRRDVAAVREAAAPAWVRIATQRIRSPHALVVVDEVAVALKWIEDAARPRVLVISWSIADGAIRTTEVAMAAELVRADSTSCWVVGRASRRHRDELQWRDELQQLALPGLEPLGRLDLGPWRSADDQDEHGEIHSFDVSGDDCWLARADGAVERWHLGRGTRVVSFRLHRGPCILRIEGDRVLSCGADGRALVLAREDARIIDAVELDAPRDGRLVEDTVTALTASGAVRHDRIRRSVTCSPCGAQASLVAEGRNVLEHLGGGTLRLRDLRSGRVLSEATPREVPVRRMAHHGGTFVVSYVDDHAVAFRRGAPGRAPWLVVRPRTSEQLLADEAAYGDALADARDALAEEDVARASELLARAGEVEGYERAAELFSLRRRIAASTRRGAARGRRLHQVLCTAGWQAARMSAAGDKALCLDENGQVAVWRLPSASRARGELLDVMHPRDWTVAVALCADGDRALTLSASRELRLWDLREEREARLGSCRTMAMAATGRRAVVARRGVLCIDLEDETERALDGDAAGLSCLGIAPSGALAVAGFADGTVTAWDLSDGRIAWQRQGHDGEVLAAAVRDDGFALTSSAAGIMSWDSKTAEARHLDGSAATRLVFGPEGLASWCSPAEPATVWDLETDEVAHRLDVARDVALTADASCAITCDGGGLRVWELDWERL